MTKTIGLKYTCCKDSDFCNLFKTPSNFLVQLVDNRPINVEKKNLSTSYLLVLLIILIVLVISLISILIYQKLKRRKLNQCNCLENSSVVKKSSLQNIESAISETAQHSSQNSKLYEELDLQTILNDDQFTIKHQAKRHNMNVFVKIYKAKVKQLWLSEINIYKLILIRHENILNFIAKSEFYDSKASQLNYLIVTEYHQLGNLECFLKSKPNLTEQQLIKLMLTASSGLNHLHLEISNNQRKPTVVHRNINSKNFIIKQNLTCALANFNYALISNELNDETRPIKMICNPINYYYCPPECLDETINLKSIVSLKCADVYSFGLVLFQILNYFHESEYRMPFHRQFNELSNSNGKQVRQEDKLKRMKKILLKQRLNIVDELKMSQFFKSTKEEDKFFTINDELLRIIKESCYLEPLSRLSIRKIENDLNKLLDF